MIKYLTMTIEKQKNIALIAHDGKKQDMLKWCMDNKEILQQQRNVSWPSKSNPLKHYKPEIIK